MPQLSVVKSQLKIKIFVVVYSNPAFINVNAYSTLKDAENAAARIKAEACFDLGITMDEAADVDGGIDQLLSEYGDVISIEETELQGVFSG